MKTYIFLTTEGHTFQPNSDSIEPDIENLQVLGIAQGMDEKNAFISLLKNSPYLLNTTFTETFCLQLDANYLESKKSFSIVKEQIQLGNPQSKI